MLSAARIFFTITSSVGASLIFMFALNRAWVSTSRREHNELIGWQISILGTTYAVILGFMLFTVWTDYQAADLNVDLEANSLMNVAQLAAGLPNEQRVRLEAETRAYAEAAVSQDWPQMAAGQVPEATHTINAEMWKTLTSMKAATPNEIIAEDHALSELSAVAAHRRTRILQSNHRLPVILWWVLITGAVVTIGSACLFGSASSWLHALQVFALSLLISLVLVAVAEIHRPFQGSVHVSDFAFRRVSENMKVP